MDICCTELYANRMIMKMGKNFMAFLTQISITNVTSTCHETGKILEGLHLYPLFNITLAEPIFTKFMFARQLLQRTPILNLMKI